MECPLVEAMSLLRELNKRNTGSWATDELLNRIALLETLSNDQTSFLEQPTFDAIADFVKRLNTPDLVGSRRSAGGISAIDILSRPGSSQAVSFVLKKASKKQLARFALLIIPVTDKFVRFLTLTKKLSVKEADLPRRTLVECVILGSTYGWGDSCNAPHIRKFLGEFPGLLKEKDVLNRLPLHIAIENSSRHKTLLGQSYHNLLELVESYPESLSISDPVSGLLPFMLAGSGGALNLSCNKTGGENTDGFGRGFGRITTSGRSSV